MREKNPCEQIRAKIRENLRISANIRSAEHKVWEIIAKRDAEDPCQFHDNTQDYTEFKKKAPQ